MQARRRRVEPAAEGEHAGRPVAAQRRAVRRLRDQPAPLQLVQDVRTHATDPPPPRGAPRPGRYGLTAGDPASQNRQGRSYAAATPTRGPVRTRSGSTGGPASTRTGDAGSVTSTPF